MANSAEPDHPGESGSAYPEPRQFFTASLRRIEYGEGWDTPGNRETSDMNLAFWSNSTENPGSSAARSPTMKRRPRQIPRAAGAAEPHSLWYWRDYLSALAITGLCTAIAFPLSAYFGLVNIVMLYLLGTTLGALRLRRGPCVLLAIGNMLAHKRA